ncbi:50S ribosomal protein L1 [Candidatus Daviesbacteria bacterium]|nr:50S ribosomal protein L1 [Candidatus Daviesbacteria bacterium]
MGRPKIKIIDDSKPAEESASAKATADKGSKKVAPKDKLATSLLEELNQEFGEVQVKPSFAKATEGKEEKKPSTQTAQAKETPKQGKAKPRSKKYQEALKQVDPNNKYDLNEAVTLAQKVSYSKFPATLELHINTNVKNLRGFLTLPFASGKKLRILAFGPHSLKASEGQALLSDGVTLGDDQILEEIIKGKVQDVDVVVTTPEWMLKLAKAAKVLGPKGLMPNPKNGTVTDNLAKTVAELQGGKTEYKTEANGSVIHLAVGKVSQPIEEITANIKSLYQIIGKTKIKKITLAPTMGPGVKLDLSSL